MKEDKGLGLKSWLSGPRRLKSETSHDKLAHLDRHRLAVLPFANMSPDPNDEYFADGMTEELISSISHIGGVRVISRTSVMKFKGGGKTVAEIGQELNAGTLLEGSVRKQNNFVRVTAQLIDVNNDTQLWTEKYDRELKNIFALQSEIAKQVAESLRVSIISPEIARIDRKPTENTHAYTSYLKGRYRWNKRQLEDVKKAVEYFEETIREDPGFALGYLGLADSYVVLRNNWGMDADTAQRKAKSMLAKALALDPDLAEAHATSGILLLDDYRVREAEEEFRKAIELKPSYAVAHMWYYLMLIAQLRWREALTQIEKAAELDPLSSVVNNNHAWYYFLQKQYDKALEMCKRVAELDPNYLDIYFNMVWILGKLQRFDDVKRTVAIPVERLQASFPLIGQLAELYIAYFRNDKETVMKLLPELEANRGKANMAAYEVAGFYFYLDKVDKGFEWLERSYSQREFYLLGIKQVPNLDDAPRSDPRYLDLIKRLGLNNSSRPAQPV